VPPAAVDQRWSIAPPPPPMGTPVYFHHEGRDRGLRSIKAELDW
jgi:hypothetical protein